MTLGRTTVSYSSHSSSKAHEIASGYNLSLDAFNALKSVGFLYSGLIDMVDKRALVDSVTIQKQADKDDWGKNLILTLFCYLLLDSTETTMRQALSTIQQGRRTPCIANQVSCLCIHNTVTCKLMTPTERDFKDGDREYIINKII